MTGTLRWARCRLSAGGGALGDAAAALRVDPALESVAAVSIHGLVHNFSYDFEQVGRYGDLQSRKPIINAKDDRLPVDVPQVSSEITPTTPNANSSSGNHEIIVLSMMEETGQDRDTCVFYLESMNWKLTEAVDLFKSMTINSL